MRRPARLCLWIAATLSTMTTVGGARGPSENSFLANELTTKNENREVLRLFFEELVRVNSNNKKWHPRHATILSRLKRDFDVASPFCENYSCFMGENLEKFVGVRGFSEHSLVVLFNYDSNSSLKGIQSCGRCRILIVTRKAVSRKRITAFYNQDEAKKILFISFVVVDGTTVRLYTPKSTGDCRIEANLAVKWKPGDVMPKNKRYFDDRAIVVLRGCTMKVAVRSREPGVMAENVNGTMTITDGTEGKMLLTVAKALNMNVHVDVLRKNHSANITLQQQMVNDIASGKAEIGTGQIGFNGERITRTLDFCNTHRFETVVWCVPQIVSNDLRIMTFEFSRTSWILIFIVGGVMICASLIFHRVSHKNLEIERQRRNRRNILITRETMRNRGRLAVRRKPKGWGKMILEVFSMSLGYPVFADPITTSARILILTFLYYALVITTAYKTSLSAALTVGIHEPLITDVNGIIAANLTTGGTIEALEVLKDQVDASPANRELIRRFVVYPNHREALNRLKSQSDFAYLGLQSRLHGEEGIGKMEDNADYYVLPDPVLRYNSMFIVKKQSAICKTLEFYIDRLSDSGIIEHWHTQMFGTKPRRPISNDDDEERRRKRADLFKLTPIFTIYALCMLASLLVFLAELIVHKFW